MRPTEIGKIDGIVVSVLNLSLDPDTPIFVGETNLQHMRDEHPEDFLKYGDKLKEILQTPDYVAKHPQKDSIEFIKRYYDEDIEEHVLVAVRATKSHIHFARTLFVMADDKVTKYNKKDALKPYKKP